MKHKLSYLEIYNYSIRTVYKYVNRQKCFRNYKRACSSDIIYASWCEDGYLLVEQQPAVLASIKTIGLSK